MPPLRGKPRPEARIGRLQTRTICCAATCSDTLASAAPNSVIRSRRYRGGFKVDTLPSRLPLAPLTGRGVGVRGKRFDQVEHFRISTVVWPGVARRQVTFSCLAKRKSPKRRPPRCAAPSGRASAGGLNWAARKLARSASPPRAQTRSPRRPPIQPPGRRGTEGEGNATSCPSPGPPGHPLPAGGERGKGDELRAGSNWIASRCSQ